MAQRVGKIQELTNNWKHVRSHENAADEATKQTKENTEFPSNSKWLKGPTFLAESEESWPQEDQCDSMFEHLEEKEETEITLIAIEDVRSRLEIPAPERFSNWNRLLRSTAWTLRIFENFLKLKQIRKNKQLTSEIRELDTSEILKAEKLIFRYAQEERFYEELNLLRKGKSLHSTSRLQK